MKIFIEKEECHDADENNELIMSDEKCKPCEFYWTCRYINKAYDEIICGDEL